MSWARAQIGKPYQWGGNGPASFDCSGLTVGALGSAGIRLPRTTDAQYAASTKIGYDALRPGDLIFYGTPGSVWHVALYSGNGMMIEAPRAGLDVRETPLRMRNALPHAGRP